ncbi:MAG: hypothetical protein FWG48_03630 [Oscillospiraceae bacterium]|nr:hypothetical protein [Oscillospiraceae bacterium]
MFFKRSLKQFARTPVTAAVFLALFAVASFLVSSGAVVWIRAATRLQESLSLLRGFLPPVAVAIAAVGYLVAYLAVQARREEYAVYRLLGIGKSKGFFLFFAELAALTVCGSLLGAAASVASGIGGIRVGALVFAVFAVCFTVGGVIALLRLGRTNMMTALAQQE